jgi:hypothetical protein
MYAVIRNFRSQINTCELFLTGLNQVCLKLLGVNEPKLQDNGSFKGLLIFDLLFNFAIKTTI